MCCGIRYTILYGFGKQLTFSLNALHNGIFCTFLCYLERIHLKRITKLNNKFISNEKCLFFGPVSKALTKSLVGFFLFLLLGEFVFAVIKTIRFPELTTNFI